MVAPLAPLQQPSMSGADLRRRRARFLVYHFGQKIANYCGVDYAEQNLTGLSLRFLIVIS